MSEKHSAGRTDPNMIVSAIEGIASQMKAEITGKDTTETHKSTLIIETKTEGAGKAEKDLQNIANASKQVSTAAVDATKSIDSLGKALQSALKRLKNLAFTDKKEPSGTFLKALSLFASEGSILDRMAEALDEFKEPYALTTTRTETYKGKNGKQVQQVLQPGQWLDELHNVQSIDLKELQLSLEDAAVPLIELYRAYLSLSGLSFDTKQLIELETDLPGIFDAIQNIPASWGTSLKTINDVFASLGTILSQKGPEGLEKQITSMFKQSIEQLNESFDLEIDKGEWDFLKDTVQQIKYSSEKSLHTFAEQMKEAYSKIPSSDDIVAQKAVEFKVMAEWIKRIQNSVNPKMERALYLKNGLPIGEEVLGTTGKVQIAPEYAKQIGANTIVHSHGFDPNIDYLNFSIADIQTLFTSGIQRAILACGEELLALDFGSIPMAQRKEMAEVIIEEYTAAAAAFGGKITQAGEGINVDASKLPNEIQNALGEYFNSYITDLFGYMNHKLGFKGREMQSLKIAYNEKGEPSIIPTTETRLYTGNQYNTKIEPFRVAFEEAERYDDGFIKRIEDLQKEGIVIPIKTEPVDSTTKTVFEKARLKDVETLLQTQRRSWGTDQLSESYSKILQTYEDNAKGLSLEQQLEKYSTYLKIAKEERHKAAKNVQQTYNYVEGEKSFQELSGEYYQLDLFVEKLTAKIQSLRKQIKTFNPKTGKMEKVSDTSTPQKIGVSAISEDTTTLEKQNEVLDANTAKVEKNTQVKTESKSKTEAVVQNIEETTKALEAEAKAAESDATQIEKLNNVVEKAPQKTKKEKPRMNKDQLMSYISKFDYAKVNIEELFAQYGVDRSLKGQELLKSFQEAKMKFAEEVVSSKPSSNAIFEKYNALLDQKIDPFKDDSFIEG